MSIINDALKKAREEFEVQNRYIRQRVSSGHTSSDAPPSPDIKWTIIIIICLVVIGALLGSVVLYKQLSKIKLTERPNRLQHETKEIYPSQDSTNQKGVIPLSTKQEVLKLNGIVYGPEDKWAIINDKIVREGDIITGGRLTFIAKDSVKITKDDGKEITLDLK